MIELCYLASPYTLYKSGLDAACTDVAKIAAKLMRAGVNLFSPICHTHMIATHGNINPLDHSIWLPIDMIMMDRCDALIVCQMPGWQDSYGIAEEVKYFEAAGRPIFDLDPSTLLMTRRKPTLYAAFESSMARVAELDTEIAGYVPEHGKASV